MATNPVNLVDAIVTVTRRQSRNRTAVLRTGKVVDVAPPYCTVRVGSNNDAHVVTAGYHTHYVPVAGHVVSLLNDGDRWLVMGQMASA